MGERMKNRWINSNKNSFKFIIILAILGIIAGFLLYNRLSDDIKLGINNKLPDLINSITSTNQNNVLYHLGVISILIISSLIIIGLPISLFYYFYEFTSIGYLLAAFIKYKGINGLLFGSIFVLINKLLFLSILSYFIINTINYTKKIINNLKGAKKEQIINELYKSFFTLGLILINDIILYFIGNKLISLFLFLL